MKETLWLIIHGHFYQPPRENPWIEAIERQPSATPYHDWNERIADECYTVNTVSRILGKDHRIIDIVNNYKKISFNIGPTLLSWIQKFTPTTYQAILDADKQSINDFSGHGNAIAQAYNHIILPLANERDKITQIVWGLKDFEYRYQRQAESIWLPETAVNDATISALIDQGIKYIILSPYQANRVRSLKKSSRWHDVSNGTIDTSQPYRCFDNTRKSHDRYIDIFFYHGELSKAVAFDHLLRDASTFMNRIIQSYNQHTMHHCISICTDGESYGHHEAFGDMGLSYMLHKLAPEKNIRITNYGEFLELHPPTMEVDLKSGPNNEGTSWSCFHGVGRWYRDCGCHTGGGHGWNQKWRQPLRDALDKLRNELIEIFNEQGKAYFKDPWSARNGYIDVVLDRSDESVAAFFKTHGKCSMIDQEIATALQLLEMQRHAMLMYTSCGWFFNDISGLETVQVMSYAARACELGNPFAFSDLQLMLMEKLKQAESNIPEYGTGKDIYTDFVLPSLVSSEQIVTHYAIQSTLENNTNKERHIHHVSILKDEYTKYSFEDDALVLGRVTLSSDILRNFERFAFALFYVPNQRYTCLVRPIKSDKEYERLKKRTVEIFQDHPSDFLIHIDNFWGTSRYSIKDMLFDDRENLYKTILAERLQAIRSHYYEIYEQNKRILIELKELEIPIPNELKIPTEVILSGQFASFVEDGFQRDDIAHALDVLHFADKLSIELDKAIPEKLFQEKIENQIKQFFTTLDNSIANELLKNYEHALNLKLHIRESKIQNYIFKILRDKLPPLLSEIINNPPLKKTYDLVNSILLLAYNFNFDISEIKDKLKGLEQQFSDNPDFWP
ncbi:DUF3536 domain-containing protein [candidate division KSB1 bacterium]|nr:DUF3536 domain-containing protein [candidate division KSB1 bacterium]